MALGGWAFSHERGTPVSRTGAISESISCWNRKQPDNRLIARFSEALNQEEKFSSSPLPLIAAVTFLITFFHFWFVFGFGGARGLNLQPKRLKNPTCDRIDFFREGRFFWTAEFDHQFDHQELLFPPPCFDESTPDPENLVLW